VRRLLHRCCTILLLSATGLLGSRAHAVTSTQTMTLTATISPSVTLSLGSNSITFGNADPLSVSSIAATEGAITVTAKARTPFNVGVNLTVLASDDLKSGSSTIGIENVSWTATGSGFQGGTLSKTAAQTVGSWTGPGTRSGTISYSLTNNPSFPTGTYSTTLTYTLSTP
jgi:hypothetical protein